MKNLLTSALMFCLFAASAPAETVRGWLACDRCTAGRARNGIFTANNPECAKQCIAQGAKTVLVDSDHKRLLYVSNPDAAKPNIGDYVEIEGALDSTANTLQIQSMKMLEQGVSKCGRKGRH